MTRFNLKRRDPGDLTPEELAVRAERRERRARVETANTVPFTETEVRRLAAVIVEMNRNEAAS